MVQLNSSLAITVACAFLLVLVGWFFRRAVILVRLRLHTRYPLMQIRKLPDRSQNLGLYSLRAGIVASFLLVAIVFYFVATISQYILNGQIWFLLFCLVFLVSNISVFNLPLKNVLAVKETILQGDISGTTIRVEYPKKVESAHRRLMILFLSIFIGVSLLLMK